MSYCYGRERLRIADFGLRISVVSFVPLTGSFFSARDDFTSTMKRSGFLTDD
jgi:hypothetical protein